MLVRSLDKGGVNPTPVYDLDPMEEDDEVSHTRDGRARLYANAITSPSPPIFGEMIIRRDWRALKIRVGRKIKCCMLLWLWPTPVFLAVGCLFLEL